MIYYLKSFVINLFLYCYCLKSLLFCCKISDNHISYDPYIKPYAMLYMYGFLYSNHKKKLFIMLPFSVLQFPWPLLLGPTAGPSDAICVTLIGSRRVCYYRPLLSDMRALIEHQGTQRGVAQLSLLFLPSHCSRYGTAERETTQRDTHWSLATYPYHNKCTGQM